jgi:hypothetical protein
MAGISVVVIVDEYDKPLLESMEGVYNPFSLLNTFANNKILYYWFETGTPTFLFNELERTNFDIQQFNDEITVSETKINDFEGGQNVLEQQRGNVRQHCWRAYRRPETLRRPSYQRRPPRHSWCA